MIKNAKKTVSFLAVMLMIISLFAVLPENSKLTAEAAGMTIEQLKTKFPNGTYWNHSGANNPDSYTNTPCTHHNPSAGYCSSKGYTGWCGCNAFSGSIQCMGFANKLAYDIYGSAASSWSTSTNLNNLKAGDVIRYKNNGHSIFVTAVNGDNITYADCNSDGHCKIMWDKTISKSTVNSTLTRVYSAPSTLPQSSRRPTGVVDSASGGAGTVSVAGWGFDPDNTGTAIDVHVYLRDSAGNMIGVGAIKADGYRDDVNRVHGCGDYHGYSATLQTNVTGNYHVMVALIDTGNDDAEWCDGGDITITAAYTPENIGDNFDAFIINPESNKFVIASAVDNNVMLHDATSGAVASKRIWNFSRNASDNSYRITSYYNSKCLDVGGDANGNVYTWDANNNDTQKWYIVKIGDNYRLMPACSSNRSLDVDGGATANKTNIQLWDNNDSSAQRFSINKITDSTAPTISDVKISDVTKDGYKVTITVSDNVGIKKVAVPTWTQYNGQDDLFNDWTNTALATQTGDNTWTYNVKVSDHNNERGVYYTDVYAWDFNGNQDSWHGENGKRTKVTIDTTNPVISDVKISDITKDGYKVTITASDNVGIKKIAVPTWTQYNGQDDLFNDWTNTALATQTGDNTWTYNVKVSDHNNERGVYYTDVYAWDFNGNEDGWRGENKKRTTINVGMYVLTVNPNGGTMKDESDKQTTNAVKITKNKLIYNGPNYCSLTWTIPTRTGYTFTGFYSDATGGTKIYGTDGKCVNEGKYFKNNLYQQANDLTVYAQWKANSYTVTFNANGGNCSTSSKSVTYDQTYGDLPTPTRTGYTFVGWFTEQNSGTQIKSDTKVNITANQTLYAQWQAEKVKGDVNNDGVFEIADVVILQKWLLAMPDTKLDNWQAADLCKDSRLDVFDMIEMRKLLVQK